jgi:hypothetical protein
MIETGVTFTPIRGEISTEGEALTNVVQAQTLVRFELRPQHIIRKNDNPELIIEFPPQVQISSP